MGWWQTLKDADRLDVAKELVKWVSRSVPGGETVAAAIEGFESLEDKEAQRRADELLGAVASDGKEILDLARHIQAETAAQRIEILSQFPGMKERFDALGQGLQGRMGELKDAVEQSFREVKNMLAEIQRQIRSFKQGKRLAARASVSDSLSVLPQERELVRGFIARLRAVPRSKVDSSTKSEMGTLASAAGAYAEAEELYADALLGTSDAREKGLIEYNRFLNRLLSKDFEGALASYQAAVSADGDCELFPSWQYRPLGILGAGGFEVAFRCREATGREVVVKAILDMADQDAVIAEAAVLQSVRSPLVVEILGYGYADTKGRKNPYLAMGYFPGRDLQSWIDARGAFAPDRAVEIARSVAQGMLAAHGAGVIHRDLKPANILYLEDGDGFGLKIIDFGLALRGKALGEQRQSLRSKAEKSMVEKDIAGTLQYAPPEQLGEIPDPVGPATPGGCTTCSATSGSGAWTGPAPIPGRSRRTPEVREKDLLVCFGAVRGTTTRGTAAARTATSGRQRAAPISSVFGCSGGPTARQVR